MLGLSTVTVVDAAADDGCPDPSTCSIATSEDASTLEEIVVPGSHIRGMEAAGSKLIAIGRDQMPSCSVDPQFKMQPLAVSLV